MVHEYRHQKQQLQAASRRTALILLESTISSGEDTVALGLSGLAIQDDDLIRLQALTNLEVLDLSNTDVSDEGIMHLTVLLKLKEIDLSGTRVTQKGIDLFLESMPNTELTTALFGNSVPRKMSEESPPENE